MIKHAIILSDEVSLFGLTPTKDIVGGWVFNESGMTLQKGQQHSLFKASVTCPGCLDAGKKLVESVCTCNND